MGKIVTEIINRFDGGIARDWRINSSNKFALSKNFDVFSYPHKMVPHYKKMVVGSESTEELRLNAMLTDAYVKFCYAPDSATTNKLFGLGIGANSRPVVKTYNVDGSVFTVDWQAPSNGDADDADPRFTDVFFYYKNYLYMWTSDALVRYKTDNSEAFDDQAFGFTPATILSTVQPVHHQTDDRAYFFYNNFVHKLNDTAFDTSPTLTLPATERITAACQYGNYLAIATVNNTKIYDRSSNARATVYLWDRDSSLATLSERIDFGNGEIVHIATLDGKLLAVVNAHATIPLSAKKGVVSIRQYLGGNISKTITEIDIDTQASWLGSPSGSYGSEYYLPKTSQIKDERLYFPMRADYKSDPRNGIWTLDSNGNVNLEIVEPELDDASVYKAYQGIYFTGNILWVSYSETTNSKTSTKVYTTDTSLAYSTTNPAVYESLILNSGDSSLTKQLIGVSVSTEPLPTDGQVVVKYRKDEETSWTTIFTHGTDNSISHQAVNIESTGALFPEYKELQFRIESTGGAVITGLKYKYEIIDNQLL